MDWKVLAYSRYYNPSICPEGLRKAMKTPVRIASAPAKVQTKHLPNKSPEHYL
jgi:hypothetical protein